MPLVSWTNVGPILAEGEAVDRVTRPLLASTAPRVYAAKLSRTCLNLHVCIGATRPCPTAGDTVLWIGRTFASACQLTGLTDDRLKLRLDRERGHPDRFTAMTPFTLLHRMGDVFQLDDRICLRLTRRLIECDGAVVPARLVSTGVDTLAGRNAWLSSFTDATSDLWAKYLLTGHIAYAPDAYPRLGPPKWTAAELKVRHMYAQLLVETFPGWLEQSCGRVFDVMRIR